MLRFALSCLLLVGLTPITFAGSVKLERKGSDIHVLVDGKEFTVYRTDKSLPKPFFHPVRSTDGSLVTRQLENPEDHKHHKGIWLSIDEINGCKHWAEREKIENASVDILVSEGNPAKLRVVNKWLGGDGLAVVNETTEISIFANRLLTYDIQFSGGDKPLTFDDTKEGLFGVRVANSMRGKVGGMIVNAEGLKGEKACWGQESKWVDYSGPVDGKVHGIVIMDHPANFRKSRHHVRDYGLYSISPFGQKSYTNGKLPSDPYTLPAGKALRLRYALAVHEGDCEQAKVADLYEFYVKNSAP